MRCQAQHDTALNTFTRENQSAVAATLCRRTPNFFRAFDEGNPLELPPANLGCYCLTMSAMATVFASFSPWTLTVILPSFSSTLTTVASTGDPLTMIFTLSPALICGLSAALGSGEGATGAGVDVAGGFALLFEFELFSVVAGSQAASVSDRSITAKSFFVMIVSIHPFGLSLEKEG